MVIVYEFNSVEEDFQELELVESFNLLDLLTLETSILFIDIDEKCAWLWFGKKVGIRDKFASASKSQDVKNRINPSFRIRTEEQYYESQKFKDWIGLRDIEETKKIMEQEEDTPYNRVIESIQYVLKSKAKGYNFWTSEGDLKQANICFQHWEAISQLCDSIGIPYKSISDEGNDN